MLRNEKNKNEKLYVPYRGLQEESSLFLYFTHFCIHSKGFKNPSASDPDPGISTGWDPDPGYIIFKGTQGVPIIYNFLYLRTQLRPTRSATLLKIVPFLLLG